MYCMLMEYGPLSRLTCSRTGITRTHANLVPRISIHHAPQNEKKRERAWKQGWTHA